MRTVRRLLYWMTAFVVVCVTFWFGYTHKTDETVIEERPVPVEIEPVGVGSIEQTVELTGYLLANKRVEVASKVAGRIESLAVTMPGRIPTTTCSRHWQVVRPSRSSCTRAAKAGHSRR